MQPLSALRACLPAVAAVLATAAAATAAQDVAQGRVFAPLAPSSDVKTAPEPGRAPDPAVTRPTMNGVAVAHEPASDERRAIDPSAPVARSFTIDHSRVEYDEPLEGTVWARGRHYKLGCEAGSATYYPLFTPKQPRHYPVVLTPDRVMLGGEPLSFEVASAPRRDHETISFDRSSFIETYALEADSLEQTFTFAVLPTAGDLVVHIPLSSEWVPIATADGLEMRSEFGRVTYGRATAIDARGVRFEAETEVLEDGIAIRVDAGFLARAALPLVVDPVVSTFAIDNTSYNDYLGDVSYDLTNNRWLAVYIEVVTASDNDAYWVLCNSAGVGMWGGYIDASSNRWFNVRCANVRSSQQFMAVGSVDNGSGSNIRGRQISAAIYSIGSEITISGSESGNKGGPQIGGDPYPFGPAYYCVTYDRYYSPSDNDILARLVSPNGTLVGPGTIYLSNSGGTIDDTSSVSRSNGGSVWTVAWSRSGGFGLSDIWAARINYDGTVVNTPYQLTAGHDDYFVSVSSPLSNSQRTMIVFQRDYGTDHDVHALVQDGLTPIASANLSTLGGGSWFNKDQAEPEVDSDGRHFVVTCAEQHALGNSTDYDIYLDDLYLSGNVLGFSALHVPLATGVTRDYWPRIASQWASGGPSGRFMLEWTKAAGTANQDIQGALYDSFEGGTTDFYCAGDGTGAACPCGNTGNYLHGCGNSFQGQGAALVPSGSISTLATTAALNASYLPPTTTCFFFQSSTASAPIAFGDGLRCSGGSLLRLATKTAVAGLASFPAAGDPPLTSAGGIGLDGGTRFYQAMYRNNAAFCTSATFNFSNGVRIVWAR